MNRIQKQNSLLKKTKITTKNKVKLLKLKQKNENYSLCGIGFSQILIFLSIYFGSNFFDIFLIEKFSVGSFIILITSVFSLIFILYLFNRMYKINNAIIKHINKMPNEKKLYDEYLLYLNKNSFENFNDLKKMNKDNPEIINKLSQEHIYNIIYHYKKNKSTISNSNLIKSVGVVYNNEKQEIIND